MSLHQRLLTVTLDLRGACPQDVSSLFYHGFDGLDGLEPIEPFELLEPYLAVRQKHQKPLGEDVGLCPAVMLPLWSYKSELLTPKTKAYLYLHS